MPDSTSSFNAQTEADLITKLCKEALQEEGGSLVAEKKILDELRKLNGNAEHFAAVAGKLNSNRYFSTLPDVNITSGPAGHPCISFKANWGSNKFDYGHIDIVDGYGVKVTNWRDISMKDAFKIK